MWYNDQAKVNDISKMVIETARILICFKNNDRYGRLLRNVSCRK